MRSTSLAFNRSLISVLNYFQVYRHSQSKSSRVDNIEFASFDGFDA